AATAASAWATRRSPGGSAGKTPLRTHPARSATAIAGRAHCALLSAALEELEQLFGLVRDQQQPPVLGLEETFFLRVREVRDQVIEVAGDVQKPARLGMKAELRPRHDLDDLLERTEAARQRHETVRQPGHERLALVHGVDDVQPGDTGM